MVIPAVSVIEQRLKFLLVFGFKNPALMACDALLWTQQQFI